MTRTADLATLPRPASAEAGSPPEPALSPGSTAPADFAWLMRRATAADPQSWGESPAQPPPDKARDPSASAEAESSDADDEPAPAEKKRRAETGPTVAFLAELAITANCPPPPAVATPLVAASQPETASGQGQAGPAGSPPAAPAPVGVPGPTPAAPPATAEPSQAAPAPATASASTAALAFNPAAPQSAPVAPVAQEVLAAAAEAVDQAAPTPPGDATEVKAEPAAGPAVSGVATPDSESAEGAGPATSKVKDGMSAAPYSSVMQALCEQNETAASVEQNLPKPEATAELSQLSSRDRKGLSSEKEAAAHAGEAALSLSGQTPRLEPEAAPVEIKSPAANAAEAVSRSLETAALTLKRQDSASVSMVLKPDNHTQLALHVKWHEGQLEAVAVLERGNLQALSADWSQLQQRLSDQGVRLAPLVGQNATASFGGGGQSASQRQPQESAGDSPALRTLAPAPSQTRASGVQTQTAHRGREWWA